MSGTDLRRLLLVLPHEAKRVHSRSLVVVPKKNKSSVYTLIERIRGILNDNYSAPHLKMAAWWTLDTSVTYYHYSAFKGNIMQVKYEDLSAFPFEYIRKIYSFLGRPRVNKNVLSWLREATQAGDVANRYQTFRNSSEMINVWQRRLSLEQIRDIEDITGVWFPYFGYSFST